MLSAKVTLALVLVPAARLLWGRVNVWRRSGRAFQVLIDEKGVDDRVIAPLAHKSRRALERLSHLRLTGVTPAVGVHLERDIDELVEIELNPYLISIYLQDGTMPQEAADELAGAWRYVLQHA